MRRYKLLGLIVLMISIISILSTVPVTFALYKTGKVANITTVSGNLIYDVVLDTDESYIDETTNTPYFFVTITNKKNNILTDVDFDYEIIVKNKAGSSGIYSYVLGDNSLSTPIQQLVITGTFTKGSEQSRQYKVLVSSDELDQTDVEYDIDYNVYQKNMDS